MLAALAQPVFLRVITFLSKNNGEREAVARALLDEPRLQIMPGCGDGMGARLIEEAGFRTGFISGSSISAMRLAMPDMDLVSFGRNGGCSRDLHCRGQYRHRPATERLGEWS